MSQESQLLLLEVIRLLNSVPDDEAVQRLQSLKKEIDTSVIMSVLRKDGDPKQEPPDLRVFTPPLGDAFQILELSAQNPNAYPLLPDLDLETLQEVTYQQLVQPNSDRQALIGTAQTEEQNQVESPLPLCDSRLSSLDITKWTNVSISSQLAARAISLYLETDHPLLGFFEPELFISDLVAGKDRFCSSFLVNSLLYWACVSETELSTVPP